jgi:hypothetical protein
VREGVWRLAFGVLCLAFGIWRLAFRVSSFEFRGAGFNFDNCWLGESRPEFGRAKFYLGLVLDSGRAEAASPRTRNSERQTPSLLPRQAVTESIVQEG